MRLHIASLLRQKLQTSVEELLPKLEELGFGKGWGKDQHTIKETMNLLLDILEVNPTSTASPLPSPSSLNTDAKPLNTEN